MVKRVIDHVVLIGVFGLIVATALANAERFTSQADAHPELRNGTGGVSYMSRWRYHFFEVPHVRFRPSNDPRSTLLTLFLERLHTGRHGDVHATVFGPPLTSGTVLTTIECSGVILIYEELTITNRKYVGNCKVPWMDT